MSNFVRGFFFFSYRQGNAKENALDKRANFSLPLLVFNKGFFCQLLHIIIMRYGKWMLKVKTTFLIGHIQEEIFMDQSEGFISHGQ